MHLMLNNNQSPTQSRILFYLTSLHKQINSRILYLHLTNNIHKDTAEFNVYYLKAKPLD